MKYYFLIALLLLTGCNEEVTSNTVNPINPVPPAQNTSTIFQPNSAIQKTSLINQHQQENTNIYPQNNMQIVVKQSLKALTEPLQQDLLDIMGTELQSVDTNFNGQRITFQYQVWRINKLSVCSQAQLNVMQFSECTQAAKQLFQTMCNDLKKENAHPRNRQLQRMYCQAAVDFKPTIAQISRSTSNGNNKVEVLRTNCNDLIFKAKISENPKDERARDQACQAYQKAKK